MTLIADTDALTAFCRRQASAAYIAVDITIKDPATYDRYKTLAPPSIAKYGGRYLVRGGTTTTLEGDWSPTRLVIRQGEEILGSEKRLLRDSIHGPGLRGSTRSRIT